MLNKAILITLVILLLLSCLGFGKKIEGPYLGQTATTPLKPFF